MKTVGDIFNKISNNSDFTKLGETKKIEGALALIPRALKKGLESAYIKNSILYIVFSHPVFQMEFKYSLSLVKSLVFQSLDIDDVKTYVSNKISKEQSKPVIPTFNEKSKGNFKNILSDKKLFNMFENIRKSILDANSSY